jgi:hypothetical protein
MMMILILMIFTYSYSDNKIKLIILKNNTNKNSMDNLIRQNINRHSQCDDHIHYYNLSTWTKKSFPRKTYNDIKLIHKSHYLLDNESLSMA